MPDMEPHDDKTMDVVEALRNVQPDHSSPEKRKTAKSPDDWDLARVSSKSRIRDEIARSLPEDLDSPKPHCESPVAKLRIENPFQFAGEGVALKAKLIGVEEVPEARGDHMCQNAIRKAKDKQRSTNHRKQRVILNVCLAGISVRGDKTSLSGAVLFPITRISFVSRDGTDSRSFGIIVRAKDGHYKFYAFKCPKSSLRAVKVIKDMFHVAYESKKAQLEDMKSEVETLKKKEDDNGNKTESEGAMKAEEGNLIDLDFELQGVASTLNTMEQTWPVPWPSMEESPDENDFSLSSSSSANNSSIQLRADSDQSFSLI